MDQTVQLSSLLLQVRFRADMGSMFLPDDQLTTLINNRAKRLWGQMTQKRVDDYVKTSPDQVLGIGTDNTPLPTDFFRLCGVDQLGADGKYHRLRNFQLEERNAGNAGSGSRLRYQKRGTSLFFIPSPASSTTIRVLYIPKLPLLAAPSDAFDGINGWEEYIILDSAIQCRIREEGEIGELLNERKAVLEQLISEMDNQDASEPMKVRIERGWDDDEDCY